MLFSKKVMKYVIALCLCGFSFTAFAVDQVAKEETSPPAEDGPLTADQIPPINDLQTK